MLKRTVKFLLSSLAEVISVGFPFCGFKILSGIAFQTSPNALVRGLGVFVLCLGVLDFIINLINFVGLLWARRRVLDACLFSLLIRVSFKKSSRAEIQYQDLGDSLDVLLSFILVALMIGFGFLGAMSKGELFTWNLCVIFNVLGAGLSRFSQSIKAHLGN